MHHSEEALYQNPWAPRVCTHPFSDPNYSSIEKKYKLPRMEDNGHHPVDADY